MLAGVGAKAAGLKLAGREESRREGRAPPYCPLQPLDLEQVDSDLRHRGELIPWPFPDRSKICYSTVTVLARLRGWSTLSPRRRAIRYASS